MKCLNLLLDYPILDQRLCFIHLTQDRKDLNISIGLESGLLNRKLTQVTYTILTTHSEQPDGSFTIDFSFRDNMVQFEGRWIGKIRVSIASTTDMDSLSILRLKLHVHCLYCVFVLVNY